MELVTKLVIWYINSFWAKRSSFAGMFSYHVALFALIILFWDTIVADCLKIKRMGIITIGILNLYDTWWSSAPLLWWNVENLFKRLYLQKYALEIISATSWLSKKVFLPSWNMAYFPYRNFLSEKKGDLIRQKIRSCLTQLLWLTLAFNFIFISTPFSWYLVKHSFVNIKWGYRWRPIKSFFFFFTEH